jgi:hypothetical protein
MRHIVLTRISCALKGFVNLHPFIEQALSLSTKQDDGYVQEALHKEVGYQTAGKAKLSPAKTKVYKFVKANFQIPQHFDKLHRCVYDQLHHLYART